MNISHAHEQAIVGILAKDAFSANDIKSYFQALILKSSLPEPVKMERYSALKGDAEFDALRLVQWAVSYGTNPEDKNSALASLILPRLQKLGVENAIALVSIIEFYRLAGCCKI